jgi:hypothetical protein
MGGNKKPKSVKKAITIRLPKEDHARLLEMTANTGVSINSFVRRTIQAVHELAYDELAEPRLPQFLAVLRNSTIHDSKDFRFKSSK